MMLADPALDLIFRDARTHNGWLDKPVDDDTPRAPAAWTARRGPVSTTLGSMPPSWPGAR
jgi:3-hydroxypropanoate dehydrogenase